MVKKRLAATLVAIVCVCLCGLAAAGYWIVRSEPGTRWLLQRLADLPGIRLQVGQVRGTLLGPLTLENIEFGIPGQRVEIGLFETDIRVSGTRPIALELDSLRLEHVRLPAVSDETDRSWRLSWPDQPAALGWFSLVIDHLDILDVRREQNNETTQLLEQLQTRASWINGRLSLTDLQLRIVELTAEGNLLLDLQQPQLKLSGELKSNNNPQWQRVSVTADLNEPGTGSAELLDGPLEIFVYDPTGRRVELSGEFAVGEEQLRFHNLLLRQSDRSGSLRSSGSVRFSSATAGFDLQLALDRLDLQPETGQPLQLSGIIQAKGRPDAYQGRFEIGNEGPGWLAVRLFGELSGSLQELRLRNLSGTWLSGEVAGRIGLTRKEGWAAELQLEARGLDPSLLQPDLQGRLNLSLEGVLQQLPEQTVQGDLQLILAESLLQGYPLQGAGTVRLTGNEVAFEDININAPGSRLQLHGNPRQKLYFTLETEDLGQVLTDASGRFQGSGWVRFGAGSPQGTLQLSGNDLSYRGWQAVGLTLQGAGEAQRPWTIDATLKNPAAPFLQSGIGDTVRLTGTGRADEHRLRLKVDGDEGVLDMVFTGGWADGQWQGLVQQTEISSRRAGDWQLREAVPLLLSKDSVQLDTAYLSGGANRFISVRLQAVLPEERYTAELNWQDLSPELLSPWLPELELSGNSRGQIRIDTAGEHFLLADIGFSAKLHDGVREYRLQDGKLHADWNPSGLAGSYAFVLERGGTLSGGFSSPEAVFPNALDLIEWQLVADDLPLTLIPYQLPEDMTIEGKLTGHFKGRWQRNAGISAEGTAGIVSGRIGWQVEGQDLAAELKQADLDLSWAERLRGSLSLMLEDYGSLSGKFDLPVSLKAPGTMRSADPAQAELNMSFDERGLLGSLFPELVRDTKGHFELDSRLAGTFDAPVLQGNFRLADAGFSLPRTAVRYENISLTGHFDDNRLTFDRLQATAGSGQVVADGFLLIRNLRPQLFQLTVKGQNLQLANLPELQASVNPDLSISGETDSPIKIRGSITVPDLFYRGERKTSLASDSPDLVIVDKQSSPSALNRVRHDVEIDLLLGNHVLVDSSGVEAQLSGSLRLRSTPGEDVRASGQLKVDKGRYASYGVSLDIERGILYYSGGSVTRPALDILALRTIGEVKAGVEVTGTPQEPVVTLYSEPAMADTDILSYIVLGRPVDAQGGETDLLMTAAGALLSQGESVVLQDKLKNRLGLDVLDFSAGAGDVNDTVITTGKYLTPDLYVSFGYSLFRNTNEVKLRYSLTRAWEVESSIGIESGVDLFYRIEIE